ncbi:hypothetical protein F5Y13DRAFT_178831 [Hypoxylon sp. FL1857]|nr:hypothetical protein F5Y13DRAFT_178831 [Hypoxylon sp. FL1857]
MSAAHPVLHSKEKPRRQRDSRSQARAQPASKSKKGKSAPATARDERDDSEDDWFAIKDIIGEKKRRGKAYYLVDWEGTDKNGHPHAPSWEPEENVTATAIDAWRRSTKNQPAPASAPAPVPAPSQSTDRGPAVTKDLKDLKGPKNPKDSLKAPGGLNSEDTGKQTSGRTKEVSRLPRTAHIVVELSRDPLFDVNKYLPVPSDSQQTSSQQSSQLAHASPTRAPGAELKTEAQRVIPDSQGFSSISLSQARDTIPDPLATSQAQGEVFAKSQSLKHPQLNFPSHSTTATTIPSHQIDRRIVGALENLSGSAFVIETEPNSVSPSNSQSTTSRGDSNHSTQENTDYDHGTNSDEFASVTSVSPTQSSSNRISFASQQSNSQAAQIVVPLSSQPGGLVTRSHSNFTVYDDDSVVPDTGPRSPQVQQDSQDSSQALSELDGNTRSTSSSKGQQRGSQPVLSRVRLSQSHPRKPANSDEAEESSIGQRTPTAPRYPSNRPSTPQQQQAAPTDMDHPEPPTSARDRLRLIRERNFASLQKPSLSLSVSTDANQVETKADSPTISHGSTQEALAIEPPARPEISPITPQMASPGFLTQPLEITQHEPTNEQQSSVAETAQAPAEQEKQSELVMDESNHVGAGYSANEEQPATLDPSTLTLSSIENDMDVSPSLPTNDDVQPNLQIPELDQFDLPHEEEEIPPNYPKSLLPYVPTGPNEYLVTLPFYNNSRPVYNDVLRENEELIREFNASFLISPHQKPHPTIISKIDEMLSRLFDICDYPTFLETIPSMTPAQLTKHAIGTNAKFAFVDELLTFLTDVKSDKKILILVRPGKVMDFLGTVVETRGYRYVRSGQEVVGASSAQHSLTVVISSTLDGPSSIPEDVDAIIAFDHTYRPELLPSSVKERSPVLMVLANTCSIQHLNMRVSESLELLERKNVLVLALVKAMRYVEDVGSSQITKLHKAAELFADYIQDPDDDDFYWEPQEVPENVFEDLHAASTQSQLSQPGMQGLGSDQHPGSRKRSHEAEDDETSSKRPRVSQPMVVTNVNHISDSLKRLIGDDSTGDSPKAALWVSVGKLEALSAKIASLEAQLRESKEREQEFRQLSDRNQRETAGYNATLNLLHSKYMSTLKERGTYENDYYNAKAETIAVNDKLEASENENAELKEKNAELEKQLAAVKEALLNSTNPDTAKMAHLEKDLEESKSKIQQLEKKVTSARNDMEYTKSAYQDASQRAGELQTENRVLERRIEDLSRRANANIVEVNRIHAMNESRELLRMLNEQKAIVRDRETELGRLKDELKTLKESRRGTRQSSVPRSPRLSAFNSPRNGARVKGGSSSRGTSPAPPPTGVFETGAGSGTPAPNNRASHLRETRF